MYMFNIYVMPWFIYEVLTLVNKDLESIKFGNVQKTFILFSENVFLDYCVCKNSESLRCDTLSERLLCIKKTQIYP